MIDNKELLTGSTVTSGGLRSAKGGEHDPGLAAHRRAVENTLTWADESAMRRRYADALAWLNVLDVIGETLPVEYETRRLEWRHALADLTARRPS